MYFTLTDVILIVILTVFTALGFFMGFVQAIGALIGLFLGVWLAGLYYGDLAYWLANFFPWSLGPALNIIVFIFIFVLVNRFVSLLFWFINKIFKLSKVIPFVGSVDKVGGLLLGFMEGVLMIAFSIFIIIELGMGVPWLIEKLYTSHIAYFLIISVARLAGLLDSFL